MRGAPVPTARFQCAAEKLGDSVWFLFEFSFREVDDAVARCFESTIGTAFVGVSVGAPWTINLDREALLLPEEVDQNSICSFAGHAP